MLNRQGISLVDFSMVPHRTGIDFSGRQHLQEARRLKTTVITETLLGKGLKSPLFSITPHTLRFRRGVRLHLRR